MDQPHPIGEQHTATVRSRREAIGRALLARDRTAANPDPSSLTEDERLSGVALFASEEGATLDQHETFEHVPELDTSLPPSRTRIDARPRRRAARIALLLDVPLLLTTLLVVCVVFAPWPTPVARTTPGRPLIPLTVPAAERIDTPPDMSGAVTVAAVSTSPAFEADPADDPEPVRRARDPRRVPPDPPTQTVSVSTPKAAEPASISEPAVAPVVLDDAAPPVRLALEPRSVAPVPVSIPRAERAEPVRPPAPELAIQAVLGQYRAAYQVLDARAARAVWPSVDEKALSKAFDRLEEQRLVFDSCDITVGNGPRAVASCRGSVTYVPRIGKARRDDQREWDFSLSKVEDAWLIDRVSAR